MKRKTYAAIAVHTALALCLAGQAQAGGGGTMDADMLNELKRMIEAQQQQLDRQSAKIDQQAEEIKALKGQLTTTTEELATKASAEDVEGMKADKMVTSKDAKVDVTLYGQINRAGLWADNGDASKLYFVDNSNSSSRLGVEATAETMGVTLGGKIEYELVSNSSSKVNQIDQDSNADINIRHIDAWVADEGFGKFSFGRGDTASNNSSEIDLSGTSVVTYTSIDDMAGGQLWYLGDTETLSELTVGSVFDNMDGLSRADRFRYDTPSFAGFSLAGSLIEEEAYDLALYYSRKFGTVKLGAGLAWADPGNLKSFENQYNGSISALHDSGFNLTFAAGTQDYEESDREDATFWYAKLGYIANIFSYGSSAFSIDYTEHNDIKNNDDEAKSFSLAYVQKLSDWGTEVYLAYRLHQLDQFEADYDDVNAVMGGARIKF